MLRRVIFRAIAGLILALAFTWLVDFSLFQYRLSRNRLPFDSVTVHEYFAIAEKNERTEYVYK